MSIRMSQENGRVLPSFFAVKKALEPIRKTQLNASIGNTYAGLRQILDALEPALQANEAMLMFSQNRNADVVECITRFQHVSGQWVENSIFLDVQFKDPQGSGSLTTYGKRYGASSLLSLNTEEDDDANAAMRGSGRNGASAVASGVSEGQMQLVRTMCEERGIAVNEAVFASKDAVDAEIIRLKGISKVDAKKSDAPAESAKADAAKADDKKADAKASAKADTKSKGPTGRPATEKQTTMIDKLVAEKGVEMTKDAKTDSGLASIEISRLKDLPDRPVTSVKVEVAEASASTEVEEPVDSEAIPDWLSQKALSIVKKADETNWKARTEKGNYASFVAGKLKSKDLTEREAEYLCKRYELPEAVAA